MSEGELKRRINKMANEHTKILCFGNYVEILKILDEAKRDIYSSTSAREVISKVLKWFGEGEIVEVKWFGSK